MKKINLEAILSQEILPEDMEKRLYFKFVYRNLIYIAILGVILCISALFSKRVFLLSTILAGGSSAVIVIYYLVIALDILLLAGICGYTVYLKIKKPGKWHQRAEHLAKRLDLPLFICHCICGLMFLVAYIATPCSVSGDSMNNTYMDKDKLICSNLFYTPKRNDVVVFDAYRYTNENDFYIKRVVAVEGDTISYHEATLELFVNDELAAVDVSINQLGAMLESIGITEYRTSFTVPQNRLIVLGDNRSVSYDSRYFGLIDEQDIFGKVLLRIYPFKRVQTEILE